MALTLSRLTREFVFYDVTTDDDLTGATAEVAFMDNEIDLPAEADWHPATLEPDGDGWRIRILIGPGHIDAVDLTPPTSDFVDYESWTRIGDSPELIVRRPGVITLL